MALGGSLNPHGIATRADARAYHDAGPPGLGSSGRSAPPPHHRSHTAGSASPGILQHAAGPDLWTLTASGRIVAQKTRGFTGLQGQYADEYHRTPPGHMDIAAGTRALSS